MSVASVTQVSPERLTFLSAEDLGIKRWPGMGLFPTPEGALELAIVLTTDEVRICLIQARKFRSLHPEDGSNSDTEECINKRMAKVYEDTAQALIAVATDLERNKFRAEKSIYANLSDQEVDAMIAAFENC